MKKSTLKLLSLLLCIAMVAGMFAACGGNGDEDIDDGINYDIDLNNKPTLNVLMPNSGKDISAVNDNTNAKLIEELTGYKVNYTQLPAKDASTVLNNELMDKREYQAMKLTKDQFADLVKDDMLTDITDALKTFAPDMLEAISPESWEVVTVDGRIYGIPERASSDNIENTIIFNYDLLMANDLELPTTLEDFETVLKTLTEQIGRPALTFSKDKTLIYSISAAFGIYADWQEYEVDGKTQVLHYSNAPQYKDYVEYMNGLYNKGYIDKEVSSNDDAKCISKFANEQAAAFVGTVWNVSAIVSSLQANGKISATEAAGTLDNYLTYLRGLKKNASDPEKIYRSSGYTYITAIPFYQAENAGYALDWMNSKIKDTDDAHNFRQMVLGEENVHWTYSASEGYLPIAANFAEKDDASYYMTGSNEKVYTQYWLARVHKQPELYRAWSILMEDADTVGVYNIADFTPPIEEYNKHRSAMELEAQTDFYQMLANGTAKFEEHLNTINTTKGGKTATDAINEWYKNYKN